MFGTAFVTFNGYEYVDFAKNYSGQGLFYYGICDKYCSGYNSLLLSPLGVDWAKNFSRIIFLSPVLEEGYISELNKISNAEIFLPSSKSEKLSRYSNINLSRENFGKIYSILCSKSNLIFTDIFDCFEKLFEQKKFKFMDVFTAIKVFEELNLICIDDSSSFKITPAKNIKRNLTESMLYNKLSLIKNISKD